MNLVLPNTEMDLNRKRVNQVIILFPTCLSQSYLEREDALDTHKPV